MIGRLNHVAIAVPDLDRAAALYRDLLGAKVSAPVPEPRHGVTVVFVELPNTKIELLHPLGDDSPIAGFLAKNAAGGIHHVCYEVPDIRAAGIGSVPKAPACSATASPRSAPTASRCCFCTRRISWAR